MAALVDALRSYVASGAIPGIVAVVARGDEIDTTVIGDLALGGAPMREDSLFRIASAGKPITAVAVLTLVADGKVAIDDPVNDLLPSGEPFAEYVKRRIFQPLGMIDSGFAFAPGRMLLAGGGDVIAHELVSAMTSDQLTPAIRATNDTFLNGQSWGYGCGIDIEFRDSWNVPGRYGWVGGSGTSAYAVPADGSVAILLTQVELGGPGGSPVLESFWSAAAAHLGHNS